jgi:hypothetical protein
MAVATWNGSKARYNWSAALRKRYRAYWRPMREVKLRIYKGGTDLDAVKDCVTRAAELSWREWLDGSRPFHWRWSEEYQHTMRDDFKFWYKGKPPTYMQAQKPEPEPAQRALMVEKLSKLLARRYFEYGDIESLTQFLKMSKGRIVIRMVYNSTSSGLNNCLWVPWFPLLIIVYLASAVEVGTHC